MSLVRGFLLVMVFLPSVTFDLIPAEIFPWAFLFAIVSMHYVKKTDVVLTAGLVVMLILSALWSVAFEPMADSLRSLLAYLNFIGIFVVFLNLSPAWVNRSVRVGKRVFIFLIVLGLAQSSGLLNPLNDLLSALVPRASSSALSEMGGRGVTLLSSEPSRAGIEIVYLYLLYRFIKFPGRGLLIIDLLVLAYLVLIIKAAQPLAFAVFAIGLLVVQRPLHAIPMLILLLFAPFVDFDIGNSRAVFLIKKAIAEANFSDVIFLVANESGHRLLTIYSFFIFGIMHPLGAGIGMWKLSSIQALNESGVDITQFRYFIIHGGGDVVSVRGSGVLTNMLLDIGIVGVGIFLLWLFTLTQRLRFRDRSTIAIMLILLVKISFLGSVGEPLPWVATALILRINAARRLRDEPVRRFHPQWV